MKYVKSSRRIAAITLLALALMGARCGDAEATSIDKAEQAAGALAASIDAAITLSDKLALDKHISDSQEKLLNQLLLGVNSANKIFYAEVKKARAAGQWNADVKKTLAAAFVNVNAELVKLNNVGAFNVSNPESKEKLDLILKSINSASQIINGILR